MAFFVLSYFNKKWGAGYRKEKRYSTEISTHNRGIRKLYSLDEIDFFLISCLPWEDIYVIPRIATGDSINIGLYPHRKKGMDKSGYEQYKNRFDLLLKAIGKSQEHGT
jgi:hypothetical protein